MKIIEIKNLEYNLDGFCLNIPELEIKKNEKVAILGENGSGKTTFLNIISGYYQTKNTVKIYDNYIENISSELRAKKIAYLPQFSEILFNFTVFETILMGRFPHLKDFDFSEKDYSNTEKIIKEFNLENYKEKLFVKLSGGEKKRVMLARIFNQESEILLLDEPFAMLDVKHTIELIKILKKIKKTILCIVHDINIALLLFDRLIFLKNGRLIYNILKEELNEEILYNVFDVNFVCNNNYYFFKV